MSLVYICVVVVGGVFLVLLIVSLVLIKGDRIKSERWAERPLGIPTGSVRAMLALVIVIVAVWAATGPEPGFVDKVPEWLLGILGAVIGFYFGSRGIKTSNREESAFDRLERLKTLKDSGIITGEEFVEKKKDLLGRI